VHQAADFEKHQLVAIKVVDLDEVDEAMIESYKNEITLLKVAGLGQKISEGLYGKWYPRTP
jgi:hypothetical protein